MSESSVQSSRAGNRVAPFVENISEATAACLFTMVQGNVLALGLSHWLIASQTGIIAGIITALALLTSRIRKRWVIALVLGSITAVVDYLVHPGMFGEQFTEAVVTGLGAALLSYAVGWLWHRRRRDQVAQTAPGSVTHAEINNEGETG